MNITEHIQHLNIIIPVISVIIIFIVVGAVQAHKWIKSLMAQDFVSKEACKSCVDKIKEHLEDELQKKNNERSKEIEELKHLYERLREMYEEQVQTNARIEAKVDILLEDRKHR